MTNTNAQTKPLGLNATVNTRNSSVAPDFVVEGHGSIFLVRPASPEAQEWLDEATEYGTLPGAQFWCGALVVEQI